MASVLVRVGSLVVLQAPRELVALEAATAVGLGTSLLVTLVCKISIHVAVAVGAVVILALVFGPAWLLLVPLVAAVGWARVVLNDHSPAQCGRAVCWVPDQHLVTVLNKRDAHEWWIGTRHASPVAGGVRLRSWPRGACIIPAEHARRDRTTQWTRPGRRPHR